LKEWKVFGCWQGWMGRLSLLEHSGEGEDGQVSKAIVQVSNPIPFQVSNHDLDQILD
jgi:hypothetical protein